MTISRMSTEAMCTVGVEAAASTASLSPGRRVQYVAGESSFDICDLTVNLAEPVSGTRRDDDDVSRLDLVRLTPFDSRRAVLRIRHRPAGRVGGAALENVVDLRHALTIAFPAVHAGVLGTPHSTPNYKRFHHSRGLTRVDSKRGLVVVQHLLPLRGWDEFAGRRHATLGDPDE